MILETALEDEKVREAATVDGCSRDGPAADRASWRKIMATVWA